MPSGFNEVKRALIQALQGGTYQHEARRDIDVKNKLAIGAVTATDVIAIVKQATGHGHTSSLHDSDRSIVVHVFRVRTWYIKFYFLDPDTMFISVHQ